MAVNKCIFIGNLGRDPEVRNMPNGDAVTRISIACTDRWKDRASGEQKESTEWVNVSFFGKLAEIAGQYLKKGTQVYIEGKLRTRKHTDREGVERYATEIIADQMQMLGSRQEGKPASATGQENAYAQAKGGRIAPLPIDDDIPL